MADSCSIPQKIKSSNISGRLVLCLLILLSFSLSFLPHKGTYIFNFFFNFSWLSLLAALWFYNISFIVIFASIMLFLGIWLKYTLYAWLNVQLVEPVGLWWQNQSTTNWNHVLTISSITALSIIFVIFIFKIFHKKILSITKNNQDLLLKKIYAINYVIIISIISLLLNFLNLIIHFQVTGLPVKFAFPYHLAAIMTWWMLFVTPTFLVYFYGKILPFDEKKAFYVFIIILFLGLVTGATTLSRSISLFWSLPVILVLIFTNEIHRISKHKFYYFSFFIFLTLSLLAVSGLRAYHYKYSPPNTQATQSSHNGAYSYNKKVTFRQDYKVYLKQLAFLPFGRWVGLEGIMATVAYPNTNFGLLKEAFAEKDPRNDIGIYTKKILSNVAYYKESKIISSSLPGLVAILNYSNSLIVVFGGLVLVFIMLYFCEIISLLLFNNAYVSSFISLILAYYVIAGLNIPYVGLINMLEVLAAMLFLYFLIYILRYKNSQNNVL